MSLPLFSIYRIKKRKKNIKVMSFISEDSFTMASSDEENMFIEDVAAYNEIKFKASKDVLKELRNAKRFIEFYEDTKNVPPIMKNRKSS